MTLALAIVAGFVAGAILVLVLLRHRDATLAEALGCARADLAIERVRVDRLTEAVAARGGSTLILPQSQQTTTLEPSSGWWDTQASKGN